jgi:hypothetical protein
MKRTMQTEFIHRVGFETTSPALQWAKIVHASDSSATVPGFKTIRNENYNGTIMIKHSRPVAETRLKKNDLRFSRR